MADDIDDLLDEVETKFCVKTPVKKDGSSRRQDNTDNASKQTTKASHSHSRSHAKSKKSTKDSAGEDDDLNFIINDIIDGPELPEHKPLQRQDSRASQTSIHSRTTSLSQRRCNPLYVGGSKNDMGLSSAVSQRMCDQMRCTSCDFKIVSFDNYEWDSSCDYLFFRNNVPDFNKLRVKFKKCKGSRAYACQCTWRSIKTIARVEDDIHLKWVCGRHSL